MEIDCSNLLKNRRIVGQVHGIPAKTYSSNALVLLLQSYHTTSLAGVVQPLIGSLRSSVALVPALPDLRPATLHQTTPLKKNAGLSVTATKPYTSVT